MKFSTLAVALFAAITTATTSPAVDFNKWSKSDLEDFLTDFQVKFKDSSNVPSLAEQAQAHWNSFVKPYSSWSVEELQAYLKRKKVQYNVNLKAADAHDKLVDAVSSVYPDTSFFNIESIKNVGNSAAAAASSQASASYDKVSNWIFDTWSTSQLQEFVEHAKKQKKGAIKKVATSRKDLLKQAQDVYNAHVTDTSSTGQNYYPGKWIFEGWSDDSLRSWLEKHHVNLKDTATDGKQQPLGKLNHDKLVSAVRKNAASVYANVQDAHNSFLDSVGISDSNDIYDKAGKVKDSFFDSWSNDQLTEWLGSHEIVSSVSGKVPSRKELIKLARENTDSFQKDVNQYIAYAQRHANPILSKASEAAQNLVDHTFNLWESSKLETLVNSIRKDVPAWFGDRADDASNLASAAASNAEDSKDQLSNYASHLFDFWSTKELTDWLKAQGQNINDVASDSTAKASKSAAYKRDQLAKLASEYVANANDYSQDKYDSLVKSLSDTWSSVSKTAFETWSDADLKGWIDEYSPNGRSTYSAKSSHKELVKLARQAFKDAQKSGKGYATAITSNANAAAGAAAGAAGAAAAGASSGAAAAAGKVANAFAGAGAQAAAAAEAVVNVAHAAAGEEVVDAISEGNAAAAAAAASDQAGKAKDKAKVKAKEGADAVASAGDGTVAQYLKDSAWGAWGWVRSRANHFGPGWDSEPGATDL